MMRYLLALIIMTGSFSGWSQQQIPDSMAIKLKKTIEDFKDKQHAPAVVFAVIREKDIVYSEALGYADLENKTEATIDAKFPIMSVTKTFVATMLMQLAERNVLRLDDKVKKYVPEYTVQSNFPGAVATTLFQLATHTSGLPRNTPADFDFTVSLDAWMISGGTTTVKPFATDAALLRSLQFIELEYPPFHFLHPNDRHYSNLGYSVLGIALQRAAKIDFAKYVVNNICKPLEMAHTGFLTERGIRNQVAAGYRYNAITGAYNKILIMEPHAARYPGGMYSTAKDLCRYLSFQFENDDARFSKVLSPDNRAMMRTLKIGWKPAYPYVLHEGAFPGYRCEVVFNPDAKVGWVILTNANDIDFNPVNGAIADIVKTMYKKPAVPGIQKYAGTYALPGGINIVAISLKNDSLYTTYLQELLPDQPMRATGANKFTVTGKNGYDIQLEFVPAENAEIKALKIGQLTWYKQ